MTAPTLVTSFRIRAGGGDGLETEVAITRLRPDERWVDPLPSVVDVPADIRQALREWLDAKARS